MKYSRAQIVYHWLTALLILAMVLTGLAFRFDWTGAWVIRAHQVIGQSLILVLGLRIASRVMHRAHHPSAHKLWERITSHATHAALYLCMIALVVTGYVSASGLNTPYLLWPVDQTFARSDMGETLLDWHYSLKWMLLALVTLHILGALKHLLWDKDDTFTHMTPISRKD
ncbi:cytochrome b [Yoonia sp. I 8.24]|uniref:cytochrome b n=1 Tax=Yoonia sp. I 8.24 TaxID=1537229 RepID=UPI001EDD8D22|nr:cytochrome b/b6 domain-containing protein [Yoonia sp. I 8.24]MCG3268236.1 cytochrome b [Yoonia sp. I 8.24]